MFISNLSTKKIVWAYQSLRFLSLRFSRFIFKLQVDTKKVQSKDICPKMKVLFVFALALAATQALDLDTEWAAFKNKFEKNFLSATHVSPLYHI